MNICLISREYPTDDHSGGIGTYTEKTARSLAGLGHQVHVITEAVGEESHRREEGVSIHRLASTRARRLRALARARAVASALADMPWQPDIVQACEFHAEAVLYAVRRRPKARLVTRLATPTFLVDELNGGASPARRGSRSYLDLLERSQTHRSDAIISITAALADIVCEHWGIPRERVNVMNTGVDFRRRYQASSAPLPPELSGREFILYFGRLEERKGTHVLAMALPAVLDAHPGLHVVFAGNSLPYHGRPMQAYVEEMNHRHRQRLHFFPRLPQRELYPLLDHALLAVLPSLWEGMGNVSLEALDMGKPVVATLGCGFGEIVEDGRSGLLVAPGDANALEGALSMLLADRDRLAAMSREATIRAQRFDLSRVAGELVDFYKNVVTDSKRLQRRSIGASR